MQPVRVFPHRPSAFGNFIIVAFLLSQAADGIFTYVGLAQFGPSAEANPLINTAIPLLGQGMTLTCAKLFAAGLGIALHISGVHRVVALLTALYLGAAVVPWAVLLAH